MRKQPYALKRNGNLVCFVFTQGLTPGSSGQPPACDSRPVLAPKCWDDEWELKRMAELLIFIVQKYDPVLCSPKDEE